MSVLDKYLDGAKEKVQGFMQDANAGKEIKEGITQLEAMPEIEGSIVYRMELESTINYLSSLRLIVNDERLDKESVAEEIRKVMDKVQPAPDSQSEKSEEEQEIENVKTVAYNACTRALEALNISE